MKFRLTKLLFNSPSPPSCSSVFPCCFLLSSSLLIANLVSYLLLPIYRSFSSSSVKFCRLSLSLSSSLSRSSSVKLRLLSLSLSQCLSVKLSPFSVSFLFSLPLLLSAVSSPISSSLPLSH